VRETRVPAFALVALLLPAVVLAQALPDSGRILEQLKEIPAAPPPKPPPTRVEERPPASLPDSVRIPIKRLRITGSRAFSEAELLPLVRDAEGRTLSLNEVNALAERITRHYRDRGYLVARAYVPAQDVTSGNVEIAVLEGLLGEVRLNNPDNVAGSALAPLGQLKPGEPLHVRSLEGSLLTLADVPGVDIRSTLRPGTAPGTSDLLVDVAPGRRINGSVDFDNYGGRFTGIHRLGANLNVNNPLNRGDQLGIGLQTSDGDFDYGRLSYQLPFGERGARIGASYSKLQYALGETFAPLRADGEATVASLLATVPLLRTRSTGLFLQGQYDDKQLDDRVGATGTQTSRALRNWTGGLYGNHLDGLWGGGSTNFNATFTTGHVDLDPVTAAIDAASARTQGRFEAFRLSAQRAQRLAREWSLLASYTGQWAGKNLDSSEKMSVGGVTGVRAYPQGEAPGDEGRLLTAELRWQFSEGWQAQAFYDDAEVTINERPFAPGANQRRLWGYGVGVTHTREPGWVLRAFAAWRGSAQPTSDVDRAPRVWVQLRRFF
jgi:hemolysin activation/secretion protein